MSYNWTKYNNKKVTLNGQVFDSKKEASRYKELPEYCEQCKYLHFEVQDGGGWLEICEVTGGRVIGSDEGFDNCPFMEVKDE